MEEAREQADQPIATEHRAALHPDLRLMELAERNPSPGGREVLREIIERGNRPATNESPPPRDLAASLQPRSIDDSDYRTAVEQASRLQQESLILRDLYEHGATVKGATLILPAEAHELSEDRAQPFLTTLTFAQQKLPDREQAQEFYALAKTISGTTADARTELIVFKIYYDRLARDERGERLETQDADNQQKAVARTLAGMRELAREMAELETRESVEIEPEFASATERAGANFNQAARTVDLRVEALRWPAGLSAATKERLLTKTLPELDYRLERGVPRTELHLAIDRSMQRPDAELSQEQRTEIGGFLKQYLAERLRDPETRAAHTSSAFRAAREALWRAKTTTEVSRASEDFWRTQRERGEAQRLHQTDPVNHPSPAIQPLEVRERNLLFYGRAPKHYTSEMREMRIAYGLTQAERAERVAQLRRGESEPSPPLRQLIDELATRHTVRAVNHFQASLLNERMTRENQVNLYSIGQRLLPYERAFLYEYSEQRKASISRIPQPAQQPTHVIEKETGSATGRAFGAAPRASASFREYMAALGQLERQMLNETVRQQGRSVASDLTITEARALLPGPTQKEIRLRASQLAWQSLVPNEVSDRHPSPEAQRVSETIVTLQEQWQQRARIAQAVHDEATKTPATQRSGVDLAVYVAHTRETLFRGFELLDEQRAALALPRTDEPRMETLRESSTSLSAAGQARLNFTGAGQPWQFDSLRDILATRFGSGGERSSNERENQLSWQQELELER